MSESREITDEDAIKMLKIVLKHLEKKVKNKKSKKKSENRLINEDLLKIYLQNGEDYFKEYLNNLKLDDLRSIISKYGLDKTRITRKWKSKEKYIDFIINKLKNIINKGDVFK
jgi:hypothetical protein